MVGHREILERRPAAAATGWTSANISNGPLTRPSRDDIRDGGRPKSSSQRLDDHGPVGGRPRRHSSTEDSARRRIRNPSPQVAVRAPGIVVTDPLPQNGTNVPSGATSTLSASLMRMVSTSAPVWLQAHVRDVAARVVTQLHSSFAGLPEKLDKHSPVASHPPHRPHRARSALRNGVFATSPANEKFRRKPTGRTSPETVRLARPLQ
jgi:hypothetical protein